MSLKRANYLCGHQSCDNKKCSVRLSRELTRAACHVLERGFRDAKRKVQLRVLGTAEAGDDLPDLPDLAALDLPLIEDSATKISLAGVKLNDIEDNKGNDVRKSLKAKREKKQSRQDDGQLSESSMKSANSNRMNALRKSEDNGEPRSYSRGKSTYAPGSNYMKYGGIDVHCKQASGKVNTNKNTVQRSIVEMRMAGSSKLTNVYGETYGSTDKESSLARKDFLMFQKKSTPLKAGKNQMDEPIIIESQRASSTSRPNPKSGSDSKPSGQALGQQGAGPESLIPEPMDGMKVLFQYNSPSLTQPKLEVQDMLARNDNQSAINGEGTKEAITVQNKFPSLWDMSDSEGSDPSHHDLQPQFQSRSQHAQVESPTRTSNMSKNASHSRNMKRDDLLVIPESFLETSDQEDTCVSRDLKKDIIANVPKRIPGSYSARTSLAPLPEARAAVGRNSSEVSTPHKFKISTLSHPQTVKKPEKPRTADASSTSMTRSRTASTASTASKSAANATPSVLRSRTSSASTKKSADSKTKILKSRTESSASRKSVTFAADSAVTPGICRPPSTAPTAGSKNEVAKTGLPVATSKLASDSAARVSRCRTPSVTSKTSAGSSNTKLLKNRQGSTLSTQSKTSSVSATGGGRSRPGSAASNTSNDRRVLTNRTRSTASAKSKPDADPSNKVAQARATAAANQSRIPLPVSPGSKGKVSRPMNNVAAKVDCRRPMTAAINKLSPNVTVVDVRSRPQTSGNEGGRTITTSKPRLAVPSQELKREPIKVRLGQNTKCVGGEHIKVIKEPGGKLSASSKSSVSNQSSDSNTPSPILQAKKSSLRRSPLTNTTCNVRKMSRSSINNIKEAVTGLVSKKDNELHANLSKPASKIPVPVYLNDSKRRLNLETDARENNPRPGTPTVKDTVQPVYNIFQKLESEMLSSSEKAALLEMNKALILSGKAKAMRAQKTTSPTGSKEKIPQEETEQKESKKELSPRQLSNVNVRNKISLFDTLHVATVPSETRNVDQKDEELEDEFALIMELANTKPCAKSQKQKTCFTESLMEFILDDAQKADRQTVTSVDDEHSTESPEQKSTGD